MHVRRTDIRTTKLGVSGVGAPAIDRARLAMQLRDNSVSSIAGKTMRGRNSGGGDVGQRSSSNAPKHQTSEYPDESIGSILRVKRVNRLPEPWTVSKAITSIVPVLLLPIPQAAQPKESPDAVIDEAGWWAWICSISPFRIVLWRSVAADTILRHGID